jgi:hypothetical protein
MVTFRCTNVGCAGTGPILITQGGPAASSVRDAAAIWMKGISSAGAKNALSSSISMSIGRRDVRATKGPRDALKPLTYGSTCRRHTHADKDPCKRTGLCCAVDSSGELSASASSASGLTASPFPSLHPRQRFLHILNLLIYLSIPRFSASGSPF